MHGFAITMIVVAFVGLNVKHRTAVRPLFAGVLGSVRGAWRRASTFLGLDRGPWVQTRSGSRWYIYTPRPSELDVSDLGACAWINRFGGHARTCSVAEHQVRCAEYLAAWGHDEWVQLHAALHDAHEAVPPGDIAGPAYLGPWWARWALRRWSGRAESVVREALGLPEELHPAVHMADRVLLSTEVHARLPGGPRKGLWGALPAPVRTVMVAWEPDYAEYKWWALIARLAQNVAIEKRDLETEQRTKLLRLADVARREARRLAVADVA